MFRAIDFVVPAALMVTAAHATPEKETLDRATAMTAPVQDLLRTALAGAADQFVEVERPGHIGLGGPTVRGLRFATAAKMAGDPGLCKATTVWIAIGASDTPIETTTRYKIVGNLAPLPDMWNDAYEAELTQKCAGAGRVLPADNSDFGQATFFEIGRGGEEHVWQAARSLQIAIAAAKSGASVTCIPVPGIDPPILAEMAADDPEAVEDRQNQEGCAQAGATLAGLTLSSLLRIEPRPCPDMNKKSRCLSALFLRYAYFNHQALWEVKLRYEDGEGDNSDVVAVRDLTLQPSFSIYD